ncbi:MAG: TRAP transporter small permease [Betaproteobacteria bacterium]|jgi:TRAP-type C4-dicarboxylate transport system permease small subunit|nr:TRAP transporter small permease [Betaproteobacteria bacterium]
MRRALERIANGVGLVERYGAAGVLISMTALYAFNVLVRAFAPAYASLFAWIDEAVRYMLVWLVFLAVGITLELGRHVSVDIVRGRLPAVPERLLFGVIDLVGVAFSVGAAIVALNLALFVKGTGQISPTLGVPTYVLYVAPVIGFASLAFRFLLRLLSVRDARRWPATPAWLESGEG